MSMGDEYMVRLAKPSDFPAVNALLERSFHPEETLLQCLLSNAGPLGESEQREIDEDQRAFVDGVLRSSPCHVAVHGGDQIVAACLTITTSPDVPDVYEERPPRSPLLVDYFRRMNDMIDEARLAERFPGATRMLELYAVAVDLEHRRRGLSTELMREGLREARKDGIDLVFGLFTSPLSRRGAAKIGMRCVEEIDLMKYRDDEGVAIFKDAGDHSVAAVMAVDLRNDDAGIHV